MQSNATTFLKPRIIDVQNLFCEIGKYARVSHPEYPGVSGRTRIKQTFSALGPLAAPCFPPKWGIEVPPAPSGPTMPPERLLIA